MIRLIYKPIEGTSPSLLLEVCSLQVLKKPNPTAEAPNIMAALLKNKDVPCVTIARLAQPRTNTNAPHCVIGAFNEAHNN